MASETSAQALNPGGSKSSSQKSPSLPFNGELSPAKNKKFAETVLLVPYFRAKRANLKRHKEFLNELGYDCVLFDLKDDIFSLKDSLFSSDMQFGLKHIWTDQIEGLLNAIPGRKIVFSFSNPSASAIEAVAKRGARDITGMICDGGPSGDLWRSMIAYYTYEFPLKTYPLKALTAAAAAALWHPRFKKIMHEDLEKFPEHFRLLSIRGWKDKLVTPEMIDKVFEPHPHLDWQKLSLPQAGHLNGLKDYPEEYKAPVIQFLREISTQL